MKLLKSELSDTKMKTLKQYEPNLFRVYLVIKENGKTLKKAKIKFTDLEEALKFYKDN